MDGNFNRNEVEAFGDDDFTEGEVLSMVTLDFVENADVNEGMCSCVCINDEQCCGCLVQ